MSTALSQLPICPITGEIMKNPVSTPDGNTYEKDAIMQWLCNHNTEPQTRNTLYANQLIPNRALKDLYDRYIASITTSSTDEISDFEPERIPLVLETVVSKTNESKFDILVTVKSHETDEEDFQDIVLCLDNSGSMGSSADKANSGENTGLNVLDILKHGVKTIINTCNSKQRIGIVSFSNQGVIRCPLTTVNDVGRQTLINSLELIQPDGMTNLYDGIIKSWSILESRDRKNIKSTIIVFTDGEPNQDPPRGYIPQLKLLKERNGGKYISDINIYTFGNKVNSILSDEITRETGGTYGYMPDSSFIGDLLEHKVGSIRTCRAKNSLLKIEVDDTKDFQLPHSLEYSKTSNSAIQINVGDILYGQDRSFVISVELNNDTDVPSLFVSLDYNEDNTDTFLNIQSDSIKSTLDYTDLIYNKLRQELVKSISYMINYIDCNEYSNANVELSNLISIIRNHSSSNMKLDKMLQDLVGQITLAIIPTYYKEWGRHYLLSLRRAYQIEQCNNFKDYGVQHFGSKLFQTILDQADEIFTKMPPPKPSRLPSQYTYGNSSRPVQPVVPVNMTNFNSRYTNSCFHGLSLVKMGDGKYKNVSSISKGDVVKLANGKLSKIKCVIKTIFTSNYNILLTVNDSLHITPYHPIKVDGKWYFPKDLSFVKPSILECDAIYSFELYDRGCGSGMVIGNMECATLGHGITDDSVISHPFFGTELIIDNLKQSPDYSSGLVILKENSLVRCSQSGLVNRIII